MRPLAALLAGKAELHLDRAALLVASVEHPGLDPEPYVRWLDSHAAALAAKVQPSSAGDACIRALNEYLFDDLGFRGNAADYYNPSNSCLNEVLASRTGIPITLAVVCLEIGRRLALPLSGVGLPGHFLIRYDGDGAPVFLDPFNNGQRLDAEGCYALARSITGIEVPRDPALLHPVGTRHIVTRMLNNLRGAYVARRAHRKALHVVDILLEAHPGAADEYRQRALLYLHLERMAEARRDFERYLETAPADADERSGVETHLIEVNRWLARLN